MSSFRLPPQVHVLVRDWLSANHVLLKSGRGHTLIDSGYGGRVSETLALLRQPEALGEAPLARLINTHCHSDHMGGNAEIKCRYGCPIAVPQGEAPLLDAWDTRRLLLDFADQRCERFTYDALIRPGDVLHLGDMDWQAIAAPGHDMNALVFYCPEERLLISGDALWENGLGFIDPDLPGLGCLRAARACLDTLAKLPVAVVIPGHGRPFAGFEPALERAYRRLDSFADDPERMARHGLKVMFTFALLHRGSLPLADLPDYLARVGCYGYFNAISPRLEYAELARWLVEELAAGGVVKCSAGAVAPG